jgi:hypothetical protein
LVLFKSFFGLEFGWDDLEADCESKGGRSTIAASAVHTVGAQIISQFFLKYVFSGENISGHRHDRELCFFVF